MSALGYNKLLKFPYARGYTLPVIFPPRQHPLVLTRGQLFELSTLLIE